MNNTSDETGKLLDQVKKGLILSRKRLFEYKKKNGYSLIVSKNGKVVSIPPEEIFIPD
jgi:hypothetical protein